MCLVENKQHEKIFAYIQRQVCAIKAACQLFCSSLLFCFRELNCFLEIPVRDPRKILWVSWNSILETWFSNLDPQSSRLETRFSKTSKIENRVSSRDCQLTFEQYCTVVRQKIKNITVNNESMRLKLGRDVAPYEIYLTVHILVLLWQHARFQSHA